MSVAFENQVAPAGPPVITPTDRLILTLCLALITHAIIVLGVTFTREDHPIPDYSTMEIVLVQNSSEAPDEAKLLAQANLDGGGDTDEAVTPATPLPSPFPSDNAEIATPPADQSNSPPPRPNPDTPALVVAGTRPDLPAPDKPEQEQITEQAGNERPKIAELDVPTATALIENSYKIAALTAEIDRRLENKAQRPRTKFISASTREHKYAAYMEAWRAKVERIGNLNYPDAARQQRLSGSLILEVSLKPDGSISDILVRKSSGHKLLDDAAVRIVNLAAPYSPFPEAIRSETDLLHITRTWQFLDSSGFR